MERNEIVAENSIEVIYFCLKKFLDGHGKDG